MLIDFSDGDRYAGTFRLAVLSHVCSSADNCSFPLYSAELFTAVRWPARARRTAQ
jgi:hypothetical protein